MIIASLHAKKEKGGGRGGRGRSEREEEKGEEKDKGNYMEGSSGKK